MKTFIKKFLKNKINLMKTAEQLHTEHEQLLESCGVEHSAPQLYNIIKSGNLVADFSKFTDLQSGKKSDDPHDPAAHDLPPKPDTDGHYYHTIRDITWETFKSFFPNTTPEKFYNMTDADRAVCIKWFIDAGKVTKNDVANIFLAYSVWGTGNCLREKSTYKSWYGIDLSSETIDTKILLDRLTDIRLYIIKQISNYNLYGLGWTRGVMALYKLLCQYI
jgi:hypothetical protein